MTSNPYPIALIKDQAFIGGQWKGASGDAVFDVVNPANGDKIASVPDMGEKDAAEAVEAAHAAFPAWKALTGKDRFRILKSWHDAIVENTESLAHLLMTEQGKPLAEAKGEIAGAASFVEWFAEEAKRAYGDYIPAHKPDARIIVSREPVGVVAAITPWNFPASMVTRKVAPALAAGCTVVLKPAEDTPLTALALAALAEKAGFPPGVLNIVTSSLENAPAVGRVLTGHPLVRKTSFTGSTEVGKILLKQAADGVKKVSLELGGNAPFIVFPSADIKKAVEGAVASKFRNAGQTCVCANRIFIHEDIYDTFIEGLAMRARALSVGPGTVPGAEIGPLINAAGIEKVESLIADAVAQGAKVICGGGRHKSGKAFFEPTVIAGVSDSMRIMADEIFGPVAAVASFKDEGEIIRRANATEYGLACYIYTRDYAQGWRVSEALEYGMVGVNEPLLATELAPFGGVKQSGIGREGSKYGLDGFTELKYRLFGGIEFA